MNGRFGSDNPIEWEEMLDNEGAFRETVIMGLRMTRGVSIEGLKRRFNLDPVIYYGKILKEFVQEGFMANDGLRIFLTARGRMVANQVMARLV